MPAGASSTRTLWQGLSFGEAHDRSSSREGVHDELSTSAELLQGLLQVLQQFLSFRRILTLLGHSRDDGDLRGHALLALGNVALGLGEILKRFLLVGHGINDHERDRAHAPRYSQKPQYGTRWEVFAAFS
jgi:hypothetical protein